MPIYKVKGQKKYRVRVNYVDQDGAYKAKYGTANSYEGAVKKYQELYESRYIQKTTLKELCESYLLYIKERNKKTSAATINNMVKVILNTVNPDIYIEDISPVFVRKWQTEMLKTSYSRIYIQKINLRFSALMHYGEIYYGLKKNPVKLAGRLRITDTSEKDFYTLEEFKKFLGGFDKEKDLSYWVLFNVLFYTGCRFGEVMALYPSDIDFEKQSIHITKTFSCIHGEKYIREPKTSKSVRRIGVPAFLLEILKDYIQRLPVQDIRIFFNLTNNKARNAMRKACQKSGVKYIRIHDLRHSAISLLVSKEVPILEVAHRAGHASADITYKIYAHLYPKRDREIADREDEDFKSWNI